MKIELPQDTEFYYRRPGGDTLTRSRSYLRHGTIVIFETCEKLIFDRREELALPYRLGGETVYILVRHVKLPGFKRLINDLVAQRKREEKS